MKLFNKVAIIGVGLIGGSIGLAIKKRKLANEVIGVFRRPSTMRKALKARAVSRGTLDIKEGVKDADLIIIATPVGLIPEMALRAAKFARKGAIITDTGSTKAWIAARIEKKSGRKPRPHFVGSHPMAGSEQAGVESARADLLKGSPCIVTRTSKTDRGALKKVSRLWGALGAKVRIMSPKLHDRSVSLVSHLPHIVAFGLAGAVPAKELRYAAEGFRDTTRVASSDPGLWADIFLTNRREIKDACCLFEDYYRRIRIAIESEDRKGILAALRQAKTKRDGFIGKRK
jgi:prephenate dehydrogenase